MASSDFGIGFQLTESQAMLTQYQIAFAPARKSYRLLFTHNNDDFGVISVNEVGPRRSLFVFVQNTDALLTTYQQILSTLASHIAEVQIVCLLVSTQNEYRAALNVRLVHHFFLFKLKATQARCINYRQCRYWFAQYERFKDLFKKFNIVVQTQKYRHKYRNKLYLRKLGPVVAFSVY